jgi:hypothetical protein
MLYNPKSHSGTIGMETFTLGVTPTNLRITFWNPGDASSGLQLCGCGPPPFSLLSSPGEMDLLKLSSADRIEPSMRNIEDVSSSYYAVVTERW